MLRKRELIGLIVGFVILLLLILFLKNRSISTFSDEEVENHSVGGGEMIDLIFKKYNIKCKGLIHIGAHACQERDMYLKNGLSDENIIWIEGNPVLVENIKNTLPTAKIYQGLIAETEKDVEFVITNNEQSSSFLELKEHSKEHPDVIEVNRTKMKTITLPNLLKENNIDYTNFDFLTMDIQCAEYLALQGMKDILSNFKGIFMEVNTKELYTGCASLEEIKNFLKTYGFVLKDLWMSPHGWGDGYFANVSK